MNKIAISLFLLLCSMKSYASIDFSGRWYIKNVETGLWLGNNTEDLDRWHTSVQINRSGLLWEISPLGDGWKLDSGFLPDGNIDPGSPDGGYLDHDNDATKTGWTLSVTDESRGEFVISSTYLTFGIGEHNLLTFNKDTDTPAHFVLVSEQERMQDMLTGTTASPKDATWLLPGYDLASNNPGCDNWTFDNQLGNDLQSNFNVQSCGRVFEFWRVKKFDFNQTINVPNGHYRVRTHTCYVPSEHNQMSEADVAAYQANPEATTHALLYANNEGLKVKNIYSESRPEWDGLFPKEIGGAFYPGNIWNINYVMYSGYNGFNCYQSDWLDVYVTDGTLRIGIKDDSMGYDNSWVIVGDFELQYIGSDMGTLPSNFYLRYEGHWGWDCQPMTKADDSNEHMAHFTWTGYLLSNHWDGYCFNFVRNMGAGGTSCWGPAENTAIGSNQPDTGFGNNGDHIYYYEGKSPYVTIHAYISDDNSQNKVVVVDNTLNAIGNNEKLWLVGEGLTDWSRNPEECDIPELTRTAYGIYEGTLTVNNDQRPTDAVRLVSVIGNGEDDYVLPVPQNLLAQAALPMHCSKDNQGQASRFYLRNGQVKLTVNLNDGTVKADYLDVEPMTLYAVGTLVGQDWVHDSNDYPLTETAPGSFVFNGIVNVAEADDSRFCAFDCIERGPWYWVDGRHGPATKEPYPVEGEFLYGMTYGIDADWSSSWRVPAGEWKVTIDLNEQAFKYGPVAPFDVEYTVWNGTDEAILPSAKYSDNDDARWAYTIEFNSGHEIGSWSAADPEFNVIMGTPENDEFGMAWYETAYTMPESWTYNNTVLPNGWSRNNGDVYARRYFKAEGSLDGQTVYMPTPHDDAPCEYYINGTLVFSRTGFEPGDGWYEDEVVRLTDEQKALIKTDGSLNVLAFHVHQNWGGIYADAGLYIGGEPKNLFDGDEAHPHLAMAIAQYAETLGADQALVESFKAATNYRQDLWRTLDAVRYELKKLVSPRYDYAAASAEPADQLEVYIYNIGAGQFLAGGNDWGTHASLSPALSCRPMILHAVDNGHYAIQTNLPNGLRGENDWLGYNGYVDVAAHDAWEFEAVGNGSYRIINCQNTGDDRYLGMSEDARYQVDTDKRGADNPFNHWKLITPAQFEALYAAATDDKPADVTYKIHQNTFSQNDFEGNNKDNAGETLNDSKWERNAGVVYNWKGNGVDGDYVFEMYDCKADGKVYLKQTIEGLLPGKYVVSCNGYYRDGSWDDAVAGNARQLAYLYAGSEENSVALKSILEGAGKGAGYGRFDSDIVIPDWCNHSAKFFQYGQYKNQIEVTVGEDGKLELGVFRNDADALDRDWIVVDNFRLEYYGNPGGQIVPPVEEPNLVYPVEISTYRGATTVTLPVNMKNETAIASFQFDLCLPYGVTVKSYTLSDRAKNRVNVMGNQNDDVYTVAGLYSGGQTIEAGEGELMTFELAIDETVEPGEYYIKLLNNILTREDLTGIELSNTEAKFTINDYLPGDVNNDGKVNIIDATMVVYYSIGKPVSGFNAAAADVNGDGKTNIIDATMIVYYSIGKIDHFGK